VPPRWSFALALFFGSKLVLTLVGVVTLYAFDGVPGAPPADDTLMRTQQHAVSSHRSISMWFAWDSFLYDRLSRLPLSGGWNEFSFPLLYPFLARPVGFVLGGNTALALLLISNVAFLLQLYYAQGLAARLLGDEAAARRFTRYLLLMPAAFLFQAALTESLFLCLALATFYYAEHRRWLIVGIVGYFLALSRSVGFFVVIPLALVLLRQHRYRVDPRALRGYVKVGWPLVLLPAGWLTFMAFCRWQATGSTQTRDSGQEIPCRIHCRCC
jgi:Gpi18-like mannosyltransferase